MFNLFRKSTLEPLDVSMAGVKRADRLLIVGCRDPRLIAALGAKPGLNGRVCAVDDSEARTAAAARFAEREGVLMESATAPLWELPFEDAAFDVVVVQDALAEMTPDRRASTLQDVRRVLRPGGRCLVIEPARGGLGALFRGRAGDAHYKTSGGAASALKAEGFLAVRTLAEREGRVFAEGVKKNVK